MNTRFRARIGDLDTICVTVGEQPKLAVVLLHGYGMSADDLVPFTASLGVSAHYYVPEAPSRADEGGKAWWPIDDERRTQAIAGGPRDLRDEYPRGAPVARAGIGALITAIQSRHPCTPVVLGGFSQGGMLACDAIIRGSADAAALLLLSSSRIMSGEWEPRRDRLRDLPIFISHGIDDDDISFAAGNALRAFCERAGARVDWMPFAGGHQIPLPVWRGIRRFLGTVEQENA